MLKIFLNNTLKNTTINKNKKLGAQPSDKPKAVLPYKKCIFYENGH